MIPALNEAKTLGGCIQKAQAAIRKLGVSGEVIVADNGSRDETAAVAQKAGARVVVVDKKGYGFALLGGFRAAAGQYLIMGDADESYRFDEIAVFYQKLAAGYDFVMGNRFRGKIEEGAMPFLHRYLGTPVLTAVMNLFFGTKIGDVNCGMRGLSAKAFKKMRLKNGGMEFATEMVVKASLTGCKIAEVPCNLYRDRRGRRPHLKTWSDGWRHLRFMLLFTPNWTYLIPGGMLLGLGLAGMPFLFARDLTNPAALTALSTKHTLSFMLVALTGCFIFQTGIIAKVFSFVRHFDHSSHVMRFIFRYFTLERGLFSGAAVILASLAVFFYLGTSYYLHLGLPRWNDAVRFDLAGFAAFFFLAGVQMIFTSFVLSLFYLKVK